MEKERGGGGGDKNNVIVFLDVSDHLDLDLEAPLYYSKLKETLFNI